MNRHDERPVLNRHHAIKFALFTLLPLGMSVGCSQDMLRVPATQSGQLLNSPTNTASNSAGSPYGTEVANLFPSTYRNMLNSNSDGKQGGQPSVWAWAPPTKKDGEAIASVPKVPQIAAATNDERIMSASSVSTVPAVGQPTAPAEEIPMPRQPGAAPTAVPAGAVEDALPPLPGEAVPPSAPPIEIIPAPEN